MAQMDKIQTLAIVIAFLVLIPKIQSQSYPVPISVAPPLCVAQFSLVNRACAFLPYSPLVPPSPSSPHHHHHHHHHHDDDDHDHDHDGDDHAHDDSHDHHDHGHDDDGHHDHHRRRHRHHHHSSDIEEDCCRLLKQVDDECVCGMLARLPPFLLKPTHHYTVIVEDVCEVTFECGGQFLT